MLLVQFTTTITLNKLVYSHIMECNKKLSLYLIKHHILTQYYAVNWSQWPHGLRHKSTATHLQRLWVCAPGGMDVCCKCCVLSGRVLCDELITHPEESDQLWRIVVCDP